MKARWKRIVLSMAAFVFMMLGICMFTDTNEVLAAESKELTIHFKSDWKGADIFYWNVNGTCNNPVKWPGKTMKSEGEGWYSYTIKDAERADILFTYNGKVTKDFKQKAGEWWYMDNQWYDRDPSQGNVTPLPTLTATPKPTKPGEATPVPTKAPVDGTLYKDGIKIHYQENGGNVKLTYWNVKGGNHEGQEKTSVDMYFSNDNWHSYVLEGAESASLLFNVNGTETRELFITTGEWWYIDGEWYAYGPEIEMMVTPKPTVTIAPTISGEPTVLPTITIAQTPELTATPTPELTVTPTPELTATPTPELTATPTPELTVAPTPTKPPVKGKIIVHAKNGTWSNIKIYYWGVNGAAGEGPVKFPGTAMESEGAGWYTYTIEDATSVNIIFSDGGAQTEDLTQKEGEWWYLDGKWYSEDPRIPTPSPTPTLSPTPRPTNTPTPTRDPNATPTPTPATAERTDFRDETIYFVMTARFYDGDSSNNFHCDHDAEVGNGDDDPAWRGDFKGLIEKLDYIKALGFTAIWITPVAENASGYDFHGYHAINLKKVDPRLESEDVSYQTLIDEAHKRGIKVIQDIVLNHTGNAGEEGLFPMMDRTYTLGQGAAGNSYTMTPKVSAVDSLNQFMSVVSGGKFTDYNAALSDTQNGPAYQYQSRDQWMKSDDMIYRKKVDIGWEDFTVTTGQFAGDCMELNTELPTVYNYLTDAYNSYINMGVDAFRIDTVKHISRLTMNEVFIPSFKEAAALNGNNNFYMFGEVACRVSETWNHNRAQVSPPYYTWKSSKEYAWNDNSVDGKDNLALCKQEYDDHDGTENQPKSDNVFLNGNEYHTPDYSRSSGMGVIDYSMHFNFQNAYKAFNAGKAEDAYMNDSSYNVVYVDSHDYGPSIDGRNDQDGSDLWRYEGGTDAWAENLCLMFTFRGIPCVYYGSEVEFMKGARIDNYKVSLDQTGRAYYGDYLEGNVTATDFSEYEASGAVAETLNKPLAKHLQRLNKIRAAVPALRKGQYSTEGVNGNMAFKRRYTNAEEGVDSFVCVAITDGATFSGIPNGTYTDVVTGDVQNVSNGTLTIGASGKGNMRVYVLDTDLTKAPGKVGESGEYLK